MTGGGGDLNFGRRMLSEVDPSEGDVAPPDDAQRVGREIEKPKTIWGRDIKTVSTYLRG